jgi:twitching motility protein PilT
MAPGIPTDPSLEALVRRLNAAARAEDEATRADDPVAGPLRPAEAGASAFRREWALPSDQPAAREWLGRLLAAAREAGASDLLLVIGAAPAMRVNGELTHVSPDPLSPAETSLLASALVPAERRAALASAGSVDFALTWPGLGRFRGNVHRERGGWSAAVRLFPLTLPEIGDLNLPPVLERFAELEHGLVLVTGPTGCGKSTTLAAVLRRILTRRRVHAITIEDPVEYEHPHGRSLVEHVEIGRDATSFAQALRSSLRQDPDVLLVGEMRDRESISIAITAAETGHLVLSTLHTGDAPQTVSRILDVYPAAQLDAVRTQLSVSLAGVVSQQLLPRADGNGRVPAVEVLVGTDAVRNLVRQGQLERLRTQITLERAAGMLSMDESLGSLVARGLVDDSVARPRARHAADYERYGGRRPTAPPA